jgi:UDP-N-acetylglucosamine--N-acetylmuramyl-(pentapeptide) pyrophosphoryl-undecaprenol N-acetylglucosamine transferase
VVVQQDFTPQGLAAALMGALQNPAELRTRAASARSIGVTDAAEQLADLVVKLARREDQT